MSLEISRPDARLAALSGLIDYAGLFPPAALGMEAAVAGFRAARASSEAWMVDRFICPATRLEELVGVLAPTMSSGEEPWRIAVTASAGWIRSLTPDAGSVRLFADATGTAASVELIEIRVPDQVASDPQRLTMDAADVLRAFEAAVFFEVPWQTDPTNAFDALAALREDASRALGVKIRCGGLDGTLFPEPDDVARFVSAAAAGALPLKATAGLHHPFRHTDPETGFVQHGFINILTAAALAVRGADQPTIAQVVGDEDPSSFSIDKSGLTWRDHTVNHATLSEMRSSLFVGYGSCSFAEPVADLTALGVLPI